MQPAPTAGKCKSRISFDFARDLLNNELASSDWLRHVLLILNHLQSDRTNLRVALNPSVSPQEKEHFEAMRETVVQFL